MIHQALKEVVRKLPADMPIHIAVQNAGVFCTISTEAALDLLGHDGPKWELTIRDDGEEYHAWLSVDAGCGIGDYSGLEEQ